MNNPELRRNLWLEITTHRLLAMPVVLGLAFLALAAIDKPNAIEHVSWLGLGGFGVLTMLWGSRLAANSIFDEMQEKTWDWQRLSTLGPWTMTWGKLFGATAFAWYGGLICLAVFMVTAPATKVASPIRLGLSLVLLAILFHAGAIAAALHTSRTGAAVHRRSIGIVPTLLLLYLVPFTLAKAFGSTGLVHWYGSSVDSLTFLLVSSLLFAGCAVAGAYRSMCQSLAVRTTPWMWILFLLLVTFYCAGFAIGAIDTDFRLSPVQALAFAGLLTGLPFAYVMLFTEPTGPVVLRRVAQKVRLGQWHRAWQEMPCWPVTWLFAMLCALILALHGAMGAGNLGANDVAANGMGGAYPAWRDLTLAPVAFVLLAARDASILLFFAAAPQPRRVVGTTLVYMLVLDWILPGLLLAFGFDALAALVFPLGQGSAWAKCAVALAQASLAGYFAWRRMQANFSSWRRADGA